MAKRILDLNERIWVLKQYYILDNVCAVQRAWKRNFDSKAPSHTTIQRLILKFEKTGTVFDNVRSGRPISATTPAKQELYKEA